MFQRCKGFLMNIFNGILKIKEGARCKIFIQGCLLIGHG